MTADIGRLREAYLVELGRYERLTEWVAIRLRQRLQTAGVYAPIVDARPKEVASFLKKAMRHGYADPLSEITDKAGVRIIVSLLSEVRIASAVVEETFGDNIIECQNKAEALEPDQLGYLGLHYLVTPLLEDLDDEYSDLATLICEIQIHTRAQNAWAMVSHPLLYKPVGLEPDRNVVRRINRLVALVELFDAEVATSRTAIMNAEGYEQAAMLQPLEREFLQFCRGDYDETLSMQILRVIRPAYTPDELAEFARLIGNFVQSHREYLTDLYERTDPATAHPLMSQPEAIAILERLETSREKLRSIWDASLPAGILDTLSEELGRPA